MKKTKAYKKKEDQSGSKFDSHFLLTEGNLIE